MSNANAKAPSAPAIGSAPEAAPEKTAEQLEVATAREVIGGRLIDWYSLPSTVSKKMMDSQTGDNDGEKRDKATIALFTRRITLRAAILADFAKPETEKHLRGYTISAGNQSYNAAGWLQSVVKAEHESRGAIAKVWGIEASKLFEAKTKATAPDSAK